MVSTDVAVVFEEAALLRKAWSLRGRVSSPQLEPRTDRILRELADAQIPYAVVTLRDAAEVRDDLAGVCEFPDVIITAESATAPQPWLMAVHQLGARPDATAALVSTDDAHWAAGQAGLRTLYPSSFDMVGSLLGREPTRPLTQLWAAFSRPGTPTQRRHDVIDSFIASAMQVTREFARATAT